MNCCGIDPGKKGALVCLNKLKGVCYYLSMPVKEGEEILDSKKIKNFLLKTKVDLIFLERVRGRGGWNASHVFTFGNFYGQILQIIDLMPYRLVEPKTWQQLAHNNIDEKTPKEKSKKAFENMNPFFHGKLPDGVIDAFHIANWGNYEYTNGFDKSWNFEEWND